MKLNAFPATTSSQWRSLVEKALKGGRASDLIHRTPDGLEIAPLYGDAEPLQAPRWHAGPDGAAWDIRVFADHPEPDEANRRLLEDLSGGANSAVLSIRHEPGGEGVRVGSAEDLARALDGVDLHLATVALDTGFLAPRAADWLHALAKGGPRTRIALHLDPLGAFARAGRSPGPLSHHLALAAETAARFHPIYPDARLFLASGRAVHEAGGSDAQELAFAAACAVAYAKALDLASVDPPAAFATLSVGVAVDADSFTGLTKLRAARQLVRRIALACGADGGVSLEARSSRRMLSTLSPWTNLLRLAAAGFSAAAGGAEAVVLDPFTRPLGDATALARRLARNTQLILMDEAHLGRVADPAAGSGFLDTYARDLAGAAWRQFQEIERHGGAAEALRSGWLAERVAAVRAARHAAYADGEDALIGVNRHRDPVPDPVEAERLVDDGTPPPDAGLAGADDTCPPLEPIRWSEPFEDSTERAAS